LFDVTFLMLAHVALNYGREMLLPECQGSFVQVWLEDMMPEAGKVKAVQWASIEDLATPEANLVDTFLQQLSKGDLSTQVVKWQNVCQAVPAAMREVVRARMAGVIDDTEYERMASECCSKLGAICVSAASWMLVARQPLKEEEVDDYGQFDDSLRQMRLNFLKTAQKGLRETAEVPFVAERAALLALLLENMESATCPFGRTANQQRLTLVDSPLSERLLDCWSEVKAIGQLKLDAAKKIKKYYSTGGSVWFVGTLVEDLLATVYKDELEKTASLMSAVMCGVDADACALALLQDVLPNYVVRQSPLALHAQVLARQAVTVALTATMAVKEGKKRSMDDDTSASKLKKLNNGSVAEKETASGPHSRPVSNIEAISEAMSSFLQFLLEKNAEPPNVSQFTALAVHVLEQVLTTGRGKGKQLLLATLLTSAGVVDKIFTTADPMIDVNFVVRLFDVTSASSATAAATRTQAAKGLCKLHNLKAATSTDDVDVYSEEVRSVKNSN